MSMTKSLVLICLACFLCANCANKSETPAPETKTQPKKVIRHKVISICLQPYNGFPEDQLLDLQTDMQDSRLACSRVKIQGQNHFFPENLFYSHFMYLCRLN